MSTWTALPLAECQAQQIEAGDRSWDDMQSHKQLVIAHHEIIEARRRELAIMHRASITGFGRGSEPRPEPAHYRSYQEMEPSPGLGWGPALLLLVSIVVVFVSLVFLVEVFS